MSVTVAEIESELDTSQPVYTPIGFAQHVEGMAPAKSQVMAIVAAGQAAVQSGTVANEIGEIASNLTPQIETFLTTGAGKLSGWGKMMADAMIPLFVPSLVKMVASAVIDAVAKAVGAPAPSSPNP
jgi:hypothetical protein